MVDSILLLVSYGQYVSIIKLVVFLLMFFPSWALIQWTAKDAQGVGANDVMWVSVLLGLVGVMTLIWFVVPIFVVGALCYAISVYGTALAYVKHRNGRVLDFDKVLTIDHIKRMLARETVEEEGQDSFIFVTANKNEVPRPEARTPEFMGYRVAYDILTDAISRRVESISFMPGSDTYKMVYQIDGAPVPQPALPKEQVDYFVRFAKQLGDLDIKEHRKPQKGTFYLRQGKKTLDWEIKTAGSTAGEQIWIKQATQAEILRPEDLGLTQKQVEILDAVKERKQGIFILSGPDDNGVMSTFYSILRHLDAFVNSIYTFEKEITNVLPSVTQEVYKLSDTASTTYAHKLQQVFRMGPDIMGVAECIDSETAKVICNAAQDGKLIYVVIRAEGVLQALGRWLKLVGDRKSAVRHLAGLSNQRLLRQLCAECKQGYTPNQDILKKFNLPAEKAKVLYRPGKVIYDRRGKESMCETCFGTGFVGRTGVFEMIELNDELKTVILKSKTLQEMGAQFRRAKMAYLQEQALRKVISGVTAINEMVRVLTPAQKKKASKPAAG